MGGKFQEIIVEIGIEFDCLQMFFVPGLICEYVFSVCFFRLMFVCQVYISHKKSEHLKNMINYMPYCNCWISLGFLSLREV